ncbi:unnamed protein product [Arabidopsis thaliana]|uniref:Bifunctional inhibitor/plant lipid transfer protein/seed storage helical domain-containing protein n=2 Tax=Arabidopsis thaliana TaxID=3702 RepID=A0A654FJ80_ARATH|nr:Bifunctional inhibitor/lipid-transfer protein/seed storage 2S albumin superfamily protein [Arabidopsis thaliana]AEE79926.1 Bifunctional inhibitor/lipid-transfer protein/seed storage 2S albumin superfamily protein [Arabidopsis thaliana]CAA0387438.1 unnamed protein product [Arabidopsis thaliana]VYS60892.1 unnamed protein product [Arabidopsis thaliana]|eukprot:NP_001078313.1 Bifunctional inhibitor/lipid-transfer protein/seed storage 2S albumin superfamily protein [Arabidopsis thaliana]
MKNISLMFIALVVLLTSFPTPTLSYCKESLHLCMQHLKLNDRPTWLKCCDRLIIPGPCMCKYIKDPVQWKEAYRLMASCGKTVPLNQSLKSYFKCG